MLIIVKLTSSLSQNRYTGNMKKIIFGIFAHPDDEAFGPCGTLLKESRDGSDVHLIMLTAGDAGTNLSGTPDLGAVRLEEWRQAGQLLGTKSMHYFGYEDGTLSNSVMVEIADRVMTTVLSLIENAPEDTEIEFMSFDFSGLSGHIDHIVATRSACLAFYRLQETDARFKRVRLFCLPASLYPEHSVEWLYKEPGHPEHEIDEIIDARELRDDIVQVMRTHKTQQEDCEAVLATQGDQLGLDHFTIKI